MFFKLFFCEWIHLRKVDSTLSLGGVPAVVSCQACQSHIYIYTYTDYRVYRIQSVSIAGMSSSLNQHLASITKIVSGVPKDTRATMAI